MFILYAARHAAKLGQLRLRSAVGYVFFGLTIGGAFIVIDFVFGIAAEKGKQRLDGDLDVARGGKLNIAYVPQLDLQLNALAVSPIEFAGPPLGLAQQNVGCH